MKEKCVNWIKDLRNQECCDILAGGAGGGADAGACVGKAAIWRAFI